MKVDFKHIVLADLVFCYIPVMLFMGGWCRLEIAVPSCAALAYMLFDVYRRTVQKMEKQELTLQPALLIGMGFVTLLVAFIIGYGGVISDFHDYPKHSAVVQDLSQYAWPVVYEDAAEPSLMTYYIGSYLFPGLVGQLAGSRILAEVMLGVVGWLGLMLLLVNILFLVDAQTPKKQVWAMAIYMGFYGMLLPLQTLFFSVNEDVIFGYPHWYTYKWLGFRSSLTALKWVWEQYTIPVLGLVMLYRFREKRNLYAIWMLPALICGTWGFLTLFGYAVAAYVITCVKEKKFLADLFSWQNIVCGLVGLVMVIYLAGNLATDKPAELKLHLITNGRYYLISYLPFCIFMFGIYFMLIWKQVQRDLFFYITLGILCLIPFCRAGFFNDWCLGTSMPALFLLSIYCIRFLINKPTEGKAKRIWVTLVVCIAVNVPFVLYELYTPFRYTGYPARSLSEYSCLHCEDIDVDLRTNYFTYNYEESIFYKYIARK